MSSQPIYETPTQTQRISAEDARMAATDFLLDHLVLQRDLASILLSLPQEEPVWTSFRLRRC